MTDSGPGLLPQHLDREHFIALAAVQVMIARRTHDEPVTHIANVAIDRVFRHGAADLRLRLHDPNTARASRQHLDELVAAGLLERVPTSPGKMQAVTLTEAGHDHLDPELLDQVSAAVTKHRTFTVLDGVMPEHRSREHRPLDPKHQAGLDTEPEDDPTRRLLAILEALRIVRAPKWDKAWLSSTTQYLRHSRLDITGAPSRTLIGETGQGHLIHDSRTRFRVTSKGSKLAHPPLVGLAMDVLTRNHDYTLLGGIEERRNGSQNLLATLVAIHQVTGSPTTIEDLCRIGHELAGTELSIGPWPDTDVRRRLQSLDQKGYLVTDRTERSLVDGSEIIEVSPEGWDAVDDDTTDRVRRHLEGA